MIVFNERNDRFHLDTLDLSMHDLAVCSRRKAAKKSARAKRATQRLSRILLKLEELQDEQLKNGQREVTIVEINDLIA